MNSGKKGSGLMLVALAGLLAVFCVGAWLLVGDGGKTDTKPVKPAIESSR